MPISKKRTARVIVDDAAKSLIFLSIDEAGELRTISSLGMKGALKRVLPRRLELSAMQAGRKLDAQELRRKLRSALTVEDLNRAVALSLLPATKDVHATPIAKKIRTARFSSAAVMLHVCIVIGLFKNVDPSLIKPSDDLAKRWFFDKFEKRAISQSLNLYFQNRLNHPLSPLIHPSETQKAVTVYDLGQITFNHL